jgi:hypothetical protein
LCAKILLFSDFQLYLVFIPKTSILMIVFYCHDAFLPTLNIAKVQLTHYKQLIFKKSTKRLNVTLNIELT